MIDPTKKALIDQIEHRLAAIPGVTFNFSQAIQDNVQEAMSGVKGENAISSSKLFNKLLEDNDHAVDQKTFLKARMVPLSSPLPAPEVPLIMPPGSRL